MKITQDQNSLDGYIERLNEVTQLLDDIERKTKTNTSVSTVLFNG